MDPILYFVAIGIVISVSFAWAISEPLRVRRYVAKQGWELLTLFSFSERSLSTGWIWESRYAVRFRHRDGTLVEGVIVAEEFGKFRLAQECGVPPAVARGIFDKNVALSCRKCGTTVPPGIDRCPCCHSTRDIILIR